MDEENTMDNQLLRKKNTDCLDGNSTCHVDHFPCYWVQDKNDTRAR